MGHKGEDRVRCGMSSAGNIVYCIWKPVGRTAAEPSGKGGEPAARSASGRGSGRFPRGAIMQRVQEPGNGRCVMLKKRSLSLAKTEPSSALSPFEEFERRFEDFFRRPFSLMEAPWWTRWPALAGEVSPTADIYEEGGDIVVKAEVPEKKKEEKVEKKDYVRHERVYGSFVRTFGLPAEVQTDKAQATFKDGVLEVRVPKTAEAASRTRKVTVEGWRFAMKKRLSCRAMGI